MVAGRLLVADGRKRIYDLPGFLACGQEDESVAVLSMDDLIPLPEGSNLYLLPDRRPVGFHEATGAFQVVPGYTAVAAFLPPGYTQCSTAAYREEPGASILPLFSYTPVACYKGKLHVPAVRIDKRNNHRITPADKVRVRRKIRVMNADGNRLVPHLVSCATTYGCPNAINFFLGRYEAPLPVSPVCNARCRGCISSQAKSSCPSSQSRLKFRPTPEEVADIALRHIETAEKPVVSFGQGCEGEPLLAAGTIGKAIRIIRRQTSRGTIHMNTNASLTRSLEMLFDEGLDSIRVSLNSARPCVYARYYMPRGYTFADVKRSILLAHKRKRFVALNYLVMPGLTDREDEFKALTRLVADTSVDMIQWRNLNYDPQRYFCGLGLGAHGKLMGMGNVINSLKKLFPGLRHGYFNVPKEDYRKDAYD